MKKYDVVVMGLGAMGSSAIFQLSKAGKSVLGIDQYSPPHKIGSSHGETRITRQANGEGAAYTPLALRSHEIWRELEAESGRQLLTVTGGLIISKTGTNSILHGKPNFLQQTIESAEEYGITHQLLSSSEIRARYPQFNVGDDDGAYFEDGAGFLRPEACIEVFLTLASRQGAEIRLNEKVLRFAPDGDGVRISTKTDDILADRLIVTVFPSYREPTGGRPPLFSSD